MSATVLNPLSGSDTVAVSEDLAKLMNPLAAASGTVALTVKEVVLMRGEEEGVTNKDPSKKICTCNK